ncbi:hypothetical protein OEZ84_28675, partial [Leclercia adecarboxylata]|uniref:hypothetical protein n=1 Tax=Leclercia adecarboxylata TaxID=83655 RepID=UPI00234D0A76
MQIDDRLKGIAEGEAQALATGAAGAGTVLARAVAGVGVGSWICRWCCLMSWAHSILSRANSKLAAVQPITEVRWSTNVAHAAAFSPPRQAVLV